MKRITLILLFSLLSVAVVYSGLSSSLEITGEAAFRVDADIRVTNVELESANNGALIQYETAYSKDSLSAGFVLPNELSTITYKITVENKGDTDQAIYEIITESKNDENISFDTEENVIKSIINGKTSKEFYITFKTSEGSNEVINYKLKFDFRGVYHIKYNGNGGTNIPIDQIKYENEVISLSTTVPNKDGYEFVGWESDNMVYSPGDDYTLNQDINLFAKYNDPVIPTVKINATKKTSGTTVASDTWSSEGLNFTLTEVEAGESGATIYYCKDENNKCEPTTETASGTKITAYNTLEQNIYYIRYKIVGGTGNTSGVKSYTAKVDNIVPSLTMLGSGKRELSTNASIIQSTTFGISGGSTKCINLNKNNEVVTTLKSLETLGSNDVSCTATSNAGLTSSSEEKYYMMSSSVDLSSALMGVKDGGIIENGTIILPPGGTQYGPYIDAQPGCYHVLYKGSNINLGGKFFTAQYGAWNGGTPTFLTILKLNYLPTDANYFLQIDEFATGLEVKSHNPGSSTEDMIITSIRIEYYGETCPE